MGLGHVSSNSKILERLKLKCLHFVAEQLYGFGPALEHEKLVSMLGLKGSVEKIHLWMTANDLWIPRAKR